MTSPPPPPSTNFSKDFPEKFFRSFKKKNRAKERCRKKNSCKQLGVKKKFVHRKIAQPPPQISNGPPLSNIHCFQDLVYAHELDIICVNETWLNKNILNCELLNDDYVIFRKDRESRRAGGVLIAIRANSFTNVQQYIHETNQDEELEIVAAVVVTSQQQKVLICSCYRPPDSTSNWIDTPNTYLCRACDPFDNVVICGDFNLPDISWDNTIANKTNGHPFIEVLNDHFLTQVNNFPTRGDNILDLLITSVPEHVTITQIETPENAAVFTDHSVVFYELNAFVTIQAKTRRYVYDYGKGDFEGLRSALSAKNLCSNLDHDDINDDWQSWKNTFLQTVSNSQSTFHVRR